MDPLALRAEYVQQLQGLGAAVGWESVLDDLGVMQAAASGVTAAAAINADLTAEDTAVAVAAARAARETG